MFYTHEAFCDLLTGLRKKDIIRTHGTTGYNSWSTMHSDPSEVISCVLRNGNQWNVILDEDVWRTAVVYKSDRINNNNLTPVADQNWLWLGIILRLAPLQKIRQTTSQAPDSESSGSGISASSWYSSPELFVFSCNGCWKP